MNDPIFDFPADESAAACETDYWAVFHDSLLNVARSMDPGDVVRFYAPPDSRGQASRCVVRCARAGLLWVTVSPADDADVEEVVAYGGDEETGEVVSAIIAVFQNEFGVPAPELLTVDARGPIAARVGALGLPRANGVPTGCDPAEQNDFMAVVEVDNRAQLRELVAETIEQITGEIPTVDEDGDLTFEHDGNSVYVHIPIDRPTIRIWSTVVPRVRSLRAAAVEATVMSRNEEWTSWLVYERSLVQRTVIDGDPFVPRHVHYPLSRFLLQLSTHADDLRLRLAAEN